MENRISGMIVVISNREVGVAMSDLNQTVAFIKEIEKLKSEGAQYKLNKGCGLCQKDKFS